MKRIAFLVLSALAAMFVLQSIRSGETPLDFPEHRLVSLAPSLTEIIFDLGAGDRLVGVTSYCNHPPETAGITPIGDFMNPNLERIVSLRPDLVLAERWSSSKTADRLRKLGLPVLEVPSPHSIQEIYAKILVLGEALERSSRAAELVEELQQRVQMIAGATGDWERRPSVYIEIDPPTWTVGRRSFITEAVSLCGGDNIFADVENPALQASREVIFERDPEIILSFHATADEIRRRPGWQSLRAVRELKIIDDLNWDHLSRGSPRLVEGMERLQRRLRALLDGTAS